MTDEPNVPPSGASHPEADDFGECPTEPCIRVWSVHIRTASYPTGGCGLDVEVGS